MVWPPTNDGIETDATAPASPSCCAALMVIR
jgi:hypothetical protein